MSKYQKGSVTITVRNFLIYGRLMLKSFYGFSNSYAQLFSSDFFFKTDNYALLCRRRYMTENLKYTT